METMDALYVVRPGRASTALTYSLRSLGECVDVDDVWFVGRPWGDWRVRWATGDVDADGDKWANLDRAWRLIPTIDQLSDPFLYMNDDFFFLRPVSHFPLQHRGPLATEPLFYNNYTRGRFEMCAFLDSSGYTTWDCELHTPMLVSKAGVARMYDEWGDRRVTGYQRTLYGNVVGGVSEWAHDVKVRTNDDSAMAYVDWSISCDPVTWYQHPAFDTVRECYSRPSRWE